MLGDFIGRRGDDDFFLPFFTVFEFFLVFSGELVVLYLRSNKQAVPKCV